MSRVDALASHEVSKIEQYTDCLLGSECIASVLQGTKDLNVDSFDPFAGCLLRMNAGYGLE